MPTEMPSIPSLPPPRELQLQNPPSPSTHRLRRLQSAHNLGAKAQSQSIITQRLHQYQQFHHQYQQHHPSSSTSSTFSQQQQPPSQPQPQQQQQQQQPQQQQSQPRSRSPLRRVRANSDVRGGPPANNNNSVMAATKRIPRRSLVADSMSLERLLSKGPPDGDIEGALESARFKILDQGIKADGDGMVRTACFPTFTLHQISMSICNNPDIHKGV
jgi:cell cycle arrest protein BUB2